MAVARGRRRRSSGRHRVRRRRRRRVVEREPRLDEPLRRAAAAMRTRDRVRRRHRGRADDVQARRARSRPRRAVVRSAAAARAQGRRAAAHQQPGRRHQLVLARVAAAVRPVRSRSDSTGRSTLRLGRPGEEYAGIRKDAVHVGRPADAGRRRGPVRQSDVRLGADDGDAGDDARARRRSSRRRVASARDRPSSDDARSRLASRFADASRRSHCRRTIESSASMSVGVIIVAAGRGTRLGGVRAQAASRSRRPHRSCSAASTRSIAHPAIAELVVVLPAELVGDGPALVGRDGAPVPVRRRRRAAAGLGARRACARCRRTSTSCWSTTPPGRSPTRALIDRVIAAAARTGRGGSGACRSRDTVKRVDPDRRDRRPRRCRATRSGWRRRRRDFGATCSTTRVALGDAGVEATDEAMLAERAGPSGARRARETNAT